jgi:hypothetical protein
VYFSANESAGTPLPPLPPLPALPPFAAPLVAEAPAAAPPAPPTPVEPAVALVPAAVVPALPPRVVLSPESQPTSQREAPIAPMRDQDQPSFRACMTDLFVFTRAFAGNDRT